MSKRRVLIVDDAYFMRNLIKKALKEADYEIVGEAKNGKEGVKLYFELKPDIVTMDINMPELSGIETTKLILSKDPNAKIIAVTGNNDDDIKKLIMDAGALEYLQKPFQPAYLWSKIDKVFSNEGTEIESSSNDEVLNIDKDISLAVIEKYPVEDSFEDIVIEILNKPDNSKEQTLVIKNNEDLIEFPEEISNENYDEKYKLSEENLELEAKELETKKNEAVKQAQLIAKEKERVQIEEAIKNTVSIKPELMVENEKIAEPKKQVIDSGNSPINIKPPRTKILSKTYDIQESIDIEEPILNDSEDNHYNNKKSGLFQKVKNLFRK